MWYVPCAHKPFYGEGTHPLLWADSWAARGKITVSGIFNCLNYYVIFIVYIQGGSNMTGTDLYKRTHKSVPVIFEPPCIYIYIYKHILYKDGRRPRVGDTWSAPLLQVFRTGPSTILEAFQFYSLTACSLLMQNTILDTQEFYVLYTIGTILKLKILLYIQIFFQH